jgi:hypothetical protein
VAVPPHALPPLLDAQLDPLAGSFNVSASSLEPLDKLTETSLPSFEPVKAVPLLITTPDQPIGCIPLTQLDNKAMTTTIAITTDILISNLVLRFRVKG